MDLLRAKLASFPSNIIKDYQDRLDVSWIFHDNARSQGVVLSYSELKAAIDQRIISDVTLIPMYEEVRNHKLAVDFVREVQQQRGEEAAADRSGAGAQAVDGDPHARSGGLAHWRTRTDGRIPCTASTISEIAAGAEKMLHKMRKLGDVVSSPRSSVICTRSRARPRRTSACSTRTRGTKNSGKVARLLMNFMLIRHGYLPAVIHSIERQRYYEVLRYENDGLKNLVVESLGKQHRGRPTSSWTSRTGCACAARPKRRSVFRRRRRRRRRPRIRPRPRPRFPDVRTRTVTCVGPVRLEYEDDHEDGTRTATRTRTITRTG